MTREEAIDVLKHNYPSDCFTELCEAVEIAIQALSAQPERKKGHWKDGGMHGDFAWEIDGHGRCWREWICSVCGDWSKCATNFCPNCGADMRGEQK